ncbi:hypothetical protein A2W13_03385 [Candidatus Woesebacteria bacterium RBG_16_36_11]|uniref:RCK N-terminal domain-containing protein n=3 Tax=Candidatus Woeseibacteriota TaxID=1752722 RepID=A0A1F7XCJ5_9BACT|nr:MAG: hypothetical protein A2Z67_00465 [Candidatus Woesebacteria bacterium RBG_13_36_22]OGM12499.1 MAG: hypothetical protein A2W13_03385 [Candidatus Woesebacteria bacterium RBG_16_36_11]OGM17380.1 MAG: hypothetical protein A2V55_00240 [Candidatus Woesebacteria bacterium RBG_19FT_COMBO_37_29]
MSLDFSRDFLILIATALTGGIVAKFIKLQPFVGFIVAGVVARLFLPENAFGIEKVAELGLIFLLFSTGLELSLARLSKVIRISLTGASVQIVLVTLVSFALLKMFSFDSTSALVLSLGFSLSSTAIVVKTLIDKDEANSIHGEVMVGWLLIQDLAVIPMVMIVGYLKGGDLSFLSVGFDVLKAVVLIGITIILGKIIFPRILHLVSYLKSRELMLMTATFLAIGTALMAYLFGISPAIGAFIAGVVIAESYERHSVLSETRPLRDLFVAIFFVSLGFLVTPTYIIPSLGLVVVLTLSVIILKAIINFIVSIFLGYHGRTAVSVGIGLSQIGEFSFILFTLAKNLEIISDKSLTVGVSVTLLSLIIFPILYKNVPKIWDIFKILSKRSAYFYRFFAGWDRKMLPDENALSGHIIICGYGRVGGWVGKALDDIKTSYIVVDYDQRVVNTLKQKGTDVIYGDPEERDILMASGIKNAKVIVVAIPDRIAQEAIITQVQNLNPSVKIISRVHTDDEFDRVKLLRVDKIVQPEFEAAMAIIKSILYSQGKNKEEVSNLLKSLRLSKAMTKPD